MKYILSFFFLLNFVYSQPTVQIGMGASYQYDIFYSFGVQSTLPGLLFVYHFVLIVHLKQCVISGVRQLRTNEKSEYSTQNILNTSGW